MSIEIELHLVRDRFNLDIDLKLKSQGITALFGPSGCGKTTLLRTIAGLDHHLGARVKIANMIWQDDKTFIPPYQRDIGYVFQHSELFPHLDVKGNLEYGLKRKRSKNNTSRLEQIIELLGISHLLHRKTTFLSGGEQQRVAIARALAVNPKLLLLDEPLSALEQKRKQEILPYIESLHNELEIPVIYVSHAPDEVARVADQLVLMNEGQIEAHGPIHDMLTRMDLSLSHELDASALIEATVLGHDDHYQLTSLEFPGGQISVVQQPLTPGSKVRVRIAARDVSLTLEQQHDTSILNIFPARVEQLSPEGEAQVMVKLDCAGTPLLARITRKSATLLDLQVGKQVYAQAKSVALLN